MLGGGASASLAALHQQQILQQLLQHQQHPTSLLLGPTGGVLPNNNPQLLAALALAHAHQQQPLNGFGSTSTTQWSSFPNGSAQHQQTHQNGTACSTIFIGNLGSTATSEPAVVEEELKKLVKHFAIFQSIVIFISLFGMFPGFSRIRMHTKVSFHSFLVISNTNLFVIFC